MKTVQAILFDFDGVLAKTLEDNFKAWTHSFSRLDLSFNREEYFAMEGRKSSDIVRQLLSQSGKENSFSDKIITEIIEEKNRYYAKHNKFAYYDGADEIINLIVESELKGGVVSGGSKGRLLSKQSFTLISKLDVVITGDDSNETKPSPAPYLMAAEKLGVDPQTCLVIENAPLGIESAKNAGMTCIALCSTLKAQKLLKADLVLDNMRDLISLLQNSSHSTELGVSIPSFKV